MKPATTGSLYLMPGEAVAAADWARVHGWKFRALDAAALAREEPAVEAGAGFLFPRVARIEPRALLDALTLAATRSGIEIHANRAARSIEVKHRRAVGVGTDAGSIAAGCVVACTGAWMTQLLPATPDRPDIRPVRGQMIEYAASPGLLRHIVLRKQADSSTDGYLIPCGNGRILAGSTLEHRGFDVSVTDAARVALSGFAVQTLPALATCSITRQWAGLRPDALARRAHRLRTPRNRQPVYQWRALPQRHPAGARFRPVTRATGLQLTSRDEHGRFQDRRRRSQLIYNAVSAGVAQSR